MCSFAASRAYHQYWIGQIDIMFLLSSLFGLKDLSDLIYNILLQVCSSVNILVKP